MKIPSRLRLYLFAAIAIPAFAMPSVAQNIRTVLFVMVKMDQEGNWKAAVKDLGALEKNVDPNKVSRYGVRKPAPCNTLSSGTPRNGRRWMSRIQL